MIYPSVTRGIFLRRPNRFIAEVEVGGNIEVCHVKNTGRCRELLIPGIEVTLARAQNENRKTKYDLVAVKKGVLPVNIDSQAPNKVFAEWAIDNMFPGKETRLYPERTRGDSRFDFYFECADMRGYIEVKGVTLEKDGVARFPDAPTTRGTKHMRGLIDVKRDGLCAYAVFVVQMPGMRVFTPNSDTDPEFAKALRDAKDAGVSVMALGCNVTDNGLYIVENLPIAL